MVVEQPRRELEARPARRLVAEQFQRTPRRLARDRLDVDDDEAMAVREEHVAGMRPQFDDSHYTACRGLPAWARSTPL